MDTPIPQLSEPEIDTLKLLEQLRETFYWLCFRLNVATYCHAFLEMNGVMAAYINLLRAAASEGVDPSTINQHSGLEVKAECRHHLKYLGEKMGCMFKPFLAKPENRDAFLKGFLGS